MKKVVITYGTFDLFHIGHLNLLRRLKEEASHLIVGVSTDEFNAQKGKNTVIPFSERAEIVSNIRCVDQVIAEESWEQKISDITKYGVTKFSIGDDWKGKFDYLREYCVVEYVPRTAHISTTELKKSLRILDGESVKKLQDALAKMSDIVECLQ